MGVLFITVICIIATITFIVLGSNLYNETCMMIGLVLAVISFILGFFSVVRFIDEAELLAKYEQTQYLVDTFQEAPEAENFGLTQKKIDLNQELIEAKTSAKVWGWTWYHADKILELEYIK